MTNEEKIKYLTPLLYEENQKQTHLIGGPANPHSDEEIQQASTNSKLLLELLDSYGYTGLRIGFPVYEMIGHGSINHRAINSMKKAKKSK